MAVLVYGSWSQYDDAGLRWGYFGDPVTDDGHWLAPVLTPAEAAALTARAERAERERDELRAESAAYRAERDQMRRWAEAAAADENANAAELREVRRWFADARAAVNAGGAIDLDALGAILGGSRE